MPGAMGAAMARKRAHDKKDKKEAAAAVVTSTKSSKGGGGGALIEDQVEDQAWLQWPRGAP